MRKQTTKQFEEVTKTFVLPNSDVSKLFMSQILKKLQESVRFIITWNEMTESSRQVCVEIKLLRSFQKVPQSELFATVLHLETLFF